MIQNPYGPQKSILPEELREKISQNESYLRGIESEFNFSGILALAGFWAIWNWLLVGWITPDSVNGLINAILGIGKRFLCMDFKNDVYFNKIEMFFMEYLSKN